MTASRGCWFLAAALLLASCSDAPDSATDDADSPVASRATPSTDRLPSMLGDGSYRVGKDIAPGTYRMSADGAVVTGCYWERSRANGDIIDSGLAGAATEIVVTVRATDAIFTSSNCASWHLQESSSAGVDQLPGTQPPGFCTDAATVFTELGTAFDSASNSADFAAVLDRAVTAFDAVEAPAEIGSAWSAVRDGLAGLRAAVSSADPTSTDGQVVLQAAVQDFQAQVAEPQVALEEYITGNCNTSPTN